jgi:hypothetical protein
MNRTMIVLIVVLLVNSCNRKPFVTAKIKFEKLADDCRNQQNYFRMVSGFAGERYEFEKCLPSTFAKDQMSSVRKGDTVVLNFVRQTGGENALFKVTVDIDSYPKYNFVTVDDETFMVIPTKD